MSRSTGYGQHADYVFGWKNQALQTLMDNGCFGASCKGVSTQPFPTANKCTVKNIVPETTEGCKFSTPAEDLTTTTADIAIGLPSLPGDGSGN